MRHLIRRLRARWNALGIAAKWGIVVGVIICATLIDEHRAAIVRTLTPETVGQRLRRECTSIVREALAGQGDRYSPDVIERAIADCILERGRSGR